MKRKSSVTFGPGAASLILIFVVLSLTVLGMLSLMNGRNDARLSDRSLKVIEAVYALNEQAETRYAEIDAILVEALKGAATDEEYLERVEASLPEGIALDDGCVVWSETDGARTIDCALSLQSIDSETRAKWIRHDLYAETGEEW